MRVLLAAADATFAKAARLALWNPSLLVDVVDKPSEALDRALAVPYAVVVLDFALSGSAGLELLKRMRRVLPAVPVLALTSDPTPEARIEALRFGADDCLAQPVVLAEFTARVHALARRAARRAGECLECDDLVLHCDRRRAFRAGQSLGLTEREFLALERLARAQGRPVSAAELIATIWHEETTPRDNFIAVLIQRLRKKIDEGHAVKLLQTVRGVGYAIGRGADASKA